MTMPKKGLRKIVVNGDTYNYVVKPYCYGSSHSNRLTIQSLDGKSFHSKDIVDQVTPSMVEHIIKEVF